MKYIFVALTICLSLDVLANEENMNSRHLQPTQTEVQQNRACFSDLELRGCGDPAEDPAHFRNCLAEVQDDVESSCRMLMLKLYGSN